MAYKRQTVIKFQALCVVVKHPDLFLRDLKKVCDKYTCSGVGSAPLVIYTMEDGDIIRPVEKLCPVLKSCEVVGE